MRVGLHPRQPLGVAEFLKSKFGGSDETQPLCVRVVDFACLDFRNCEQRSGAKYGDARWCDYGSTRWQRLWRQANSDQQEYRRGAYDDLRRRRALRVRLVVARDLQDERGCGNGF